MVSKILRILHHFDFPLLTERLVRTGPGQLRTGPGDNLIFQYGPYCMVHKTFLSGLHSLFSTFCDACDVQIDTFPRNKLSSNCSLIIIGLLATRRESFDSISGRFHVTEQTDPLSAQFLKCLSFQASTDRLGQKNRNQSK